MNLIVQFLLAHLIPALEQALLAHEPEAQAAILAEIKMLADKLAEWLGKKQAPAMPAAE